MLLHSNTCCSLIHSIECKCNEDWGNTYNTKMYINETTTNSKPVSNDKLNCFSHFQETNNDDILHLIQYYEKKDVYLLCVRSRRSIITLLRRNLVWTSHD